MSTNNKMSSSATLRRRQVAQWRKWAIEFEKLIVREAGNAPKIPGRYGLLTVVIDFDPKSDYIQIVHPNGPPFGYMNAVLRES
jgi:hypothetical protein